MDIAVYLWMIRYSEFEYQTDSQFQLSWKFHQARFSLLQDTIHNIHTVKLFSRFETSCSPIYGIGQWILYVFF